jgi:tRNA threonylcarbamoyladenosine biosynthesis protein TsaE
MAATMTCSSDETLELGRLFAAKLERDAVVLLYGEMGAGKTHFVKGMAAGLGITDNVTSPTFALVNTYDNKLCHFDLFRIHTEDDLYAIGFHDYIGQGVLAIEWAENVPVIVDEFLHYYIVRINKADESKREIQIDEVTRT